MTSQPWKTSKENRFGILGGKKRFMIVDARTSLLKAYHASFLQCGMVAFREYQRRLWDPGKFRVAVRTGSRRTILFAYRLQCGVAIWDKGVAFARLWTCRDFHVRPSGKQNQRRRCSGKGIRPNTSYLQSTNFLPFHSTLTEACSLRSSGRIWRISSGIPTLGWLFCVRRLHLLETSQVRGWHSRPSDR